MEYKYVIRVVGYITSLILFCSSVSLILANRYNFKYQHDLVKCSNISLDYYNNNTCFHINCKYEYHNKRKYTFDNYCCNTNSYNCKQNYKDESTVKVYIFNENKSSYTCMIAFLLICSSFAILLSCIVSSRSDRPVGTNSNNNQYIL